MRNEIDPNVPFSSPLFLPLPQKALGVVFETILFTETDCQETIQAFNRRIVNDVLRTLSSRYLKGYDCLGKHVEQQQYRNIQTSHIVTEFEAVAVVLNQGTLSCARA